MSTRRSWTYRGHHAQCDETPEAWVVTVDGRRVGAKLTEPKAVALAYATIDGIAADAELLPSLRAVADAGYGVKGSGFDDRRDAVGVGAWVESHGAWRRGVVVKAGPIKVTVAWVKGPKSTEVQRSVRRYSEIVVV